MPNTDGMAQEVPMFRMVQNLNGGSRRTMVPARTHALDLRSATSAIGFLERRAPDLGFTNRS